MPRHLRPEDEALPVMVPRYVKPLVPVSADRLHRLREHLVKALHEARELRCIAAPCPTPPSGFAAKVASTACRLCKGWCCRRGGDDAYLDGYTMARIHRAIPYRKAGRVMRLYMERVPAVAYEGSCIFHGSSGCTLDRFLRADICNSYFCGGLTAYFREGNDDAPRVVLAGKGDAMRSSERLCP